MHISESGLHLIEQFEGYSSGPYWDPYGRVWTRGYGETEGIGPWSQHLTRTQAETRLRELVEQRYEPAIHDLNTELNQNQWDALCSFAWNLGAGIFTGELRAALQAHEWRSAANQMLAYDHAGGQVLEGLAIRRRLESELFLRIPEPYVPADETRWEHQYDQLQHRRTPWARMRRRVLQRYMRNRLIEILHRVEHEHDGWDKLNRPSRYRALLERTR